MPESPDKFKTLRDAIPLLDHMERCCAVKIEHPNAAKTHVNPCPLCGHNDCCTVYKDTNSFKCFSAACDKAGDIINFERYRLGLDSNLAAAEALIDQYNINMDNPAASIRRTAPPRPESKPPEKPPLPGIDPARARALRNLMTCYYHDQLMHNADALKYQTAIRGHAPETLISEQIGWSPGTWEMATAAEAAGYTKQDLTAIGLLRQTEKGFSLVIPAGLYVYPHRNADGHTLHYTLKDPGKKRKWQPVKAAADPEWLTFGQGAMDAEEYWIVEGEDDRLTLLDHGIQNVCAIIGNTKVTAIRDHAAETASGKTIYMAFDPDDAGRAYAQKFTRALTKAGATIKSVMPSLEQWGDDIDALLRKAENPAGLLAEITKNAQILTTAPPKTPVPAHPSEVLDQFKTWNVLGEMANNDIAFWSMDQGKAKTYKIAIKNLTLDQLVQIGGQEINDKTCRTLQEQTDTGRIMFSTLKKIIIIHASRTQLGNMPHLGQGIHYLKSGERLLLVNGTSGWVWDGQQLIEHQYPLIERQFMAFETGTEWLDIEMLAASLATMNQEKAYATLTQFLDILRQWTFESRMDRLTIAGWVIAQILQGVWDWRPHLWLSGTQGSGKSKLLKTLKDIFGKYMEVWEANITSPPGLRQKMQEAQKMTCLDEFEASKNKARDEIIELLRSAGRTGEGAKGSPHGSGGQVYALKHMVMCCSIEVGLTRAAEKSRFLLASTRKQPNHPTPESPSTAACEQLKHDLIAMAIWGFRRAKRLVKRRTVCGENRFTESIAVPYSMIAICTDDPQKSLNDNLSEYIAEFERRNSGTVLEDEYAVLQDILLSSVRVTETHEDTGLNGVTSTKLVIVERTVGQILANNPLPPDYIDTLQTCGLKLTRENELFVAHELAARKLLNNTRWRGLSILEILRRLPGAEHKQLTIGGTRAWGILIPQIVWKGNE